MKRAATVLSAMAAFAAFSVALTSLTFNPSTGEGFVSRDTVASKIGQKNLDGIYFSYLTETTTTVTCIKNEKRNKLRRTFSSEAQVGGAVAHSLRKNFQGQATGYDLQGFVPGSVAGGGQGTIPRCEDGWKMESGPATTRNERLMVHHPNGAVADLSR
jgi:hypothetical protein